ncbi:MAG: glucose-6-phosphate isomerase [Pseudomonadota bacterium]
MEAVWRDLRALRARRLDMRAAFAADAERFSRYSLQAGPWFLDYSKNLIDAPVMAALFELARASGVADDRDAMFAGAAINVTEDRAVGHWALRDRRAAASLVGGRNVAPDVQRVLDQMRRFSSALRDGSWRGFTGQRITDVVNVGIGGSDLGPSMVCHALRGRSDGRIAAHFVSNVDAAHIRETLRSLEPASTLFIIASKTFTTQETLRNAKSARRWLVDALGDDAAVARHFVALSTNAAEVTAFGIDAANMFEFWDWVGGRYSLWSAVGLSIACQAGFDQFEALLDGAHAMDRHFQEAPFEHNMPVVMGLIGVWYANVLGAETHAILPYDQYLHRLPAYLQQLDMESNGKSVRLDGGAVRGSSGPIVWGEPGTNGQHAFFQLLHQGTRLVPVDFIAAAHGQHDDVHHRILLANCIAQAEALLRGKDAAAVAVELANTPNRATLTPHKVFPGNRPSNMLLCRHLDACALGALIALYEHRTFVQGAVFGVNSFDQWGVELGKELARALEPELFDGEPGAHDGSTTGLIHTLRALRSGS